MFGLFRKKRSALRADAGGTTAQGLPRGVLPTQVTDSEVVLCKAGPAVSDTREIRLALFMASAANKRFVLQVNPQAQIDAAVIERVSAQRGEIRRAESPGYSVYFGCRHPDGTESGWTLGDERALAGFRAALRSAWLRERLHVGAVIPQRDLIQLGNELWEESIDMQNIDGENAREALLALMVEAMKAEGAVFIQ